MKTDYTCPVGGERFSVLDPSIRDAFFGTSATVAQPWPECPGNGMIVFDENLDADQVERLTPFVLGAQYQHWRRTETPHFLVAQMLQHLQAPRQQQAVEMLRATWEASAAQYPRYAERALELYEPLCPDDAPAVQDWHSCQHIRSELEQGLGKEEVARARRERLQPLTEKDPAGWRWRQDMGQLAPWSRRSPESD